jgi:hypothetical protein
MQWLLPNCWPPETPAGNQYEDPRGTGRSASSRHKRVLPYPRGTHGLHDLHFWFACAVSYTGCKTRSNPMYMAHTIHRPFAQHVCQRSTIIIYCQVLFPWCAHFTKILGPLLSGIRSIFPTIHNIRDFTIVTTAGDLHKSTSFSLCNVLNAFINSRVIYILAHSKRPRFRPINR